MRIIKKIMFISVSYTHLHYGIFFIGAIVIYSVLNIGLHIKYQKEVFRQKQKCKRKLYEMFLNKKLSDLNKISSGNVIENFSDDFETYISAIVEMKPLLWVSVIIMMLLSFFLFRINVLLILIIFLLAMLQLIPVSYTHLDVYKRQLRDRSI